MKTKAQFGLLDSRNPLLPPPSANHKTRTRIKNALLLGSSAGPSDCSSARPLQGAVFHAVFRASARRVSEEEMAITYRLKTVRVQFIAEPESDERGCAPAV